jgi:antirestriction protein ArdC
MATNNVYQIITDRIIDKLNQGVSPWVKPWSNDNRLAMNFISKKPYKGINFILTNFSQFSSPYWLSYKQASSLGGQVKAGSKSTPIVYYQKLNKQDASGKDQTYMLCKYFSCFNLDQIEGIEVEKSTIQPNPFKAIESAELIVKNWTNKPKIEFNDQSAYYKTSSDIINMPRKESFKIPEAYYSTLFHELGHSTGSVNRLNREGVTQPIKFKSHSYSKEELIAEMTSSFLCANAGIDCQIDQSASYIQSWLKVLQGDSKLVLQAASAAQKASDLILGTNIASDEVE